MLDQYEVAATQHKLTIVHNALNAVELKVPSATSTRQRGQLGWTAFLLHTASSGRRPSRSYAGVIIIVGLQAPQPAQINGPAIAANYFSNGNHVLIRVTTGF
jgi:hypothetical protein